MYVSNKSCGDLLFKFFCICVILNVRRVSDEYRNNKRSIILFYTNNKVTFNTDRL